MDVYDFTQALRRQRRLLIVGAVLLLVATFFLTFKPSSGGLAPRIAPNYEATVRMVVTDGNVDSLANVTSSGDAMAPAAAFFETLLMGQDVTLAIAESTGADIKEFSASATGSAITVHAVSSTPDGARAVALGAYDWLTERLDEPLDLVSVTPTTPPQSLLDSQGRMTTEVAVSVSSAFAEEGDGLWIELIANESEFKTVSLVDAALEGATASAVPLQPGGELTLRLEDMMRNELDTLTLTIPELIGDETQPHLFQLRIDRGAILGVTPGTVTEDGQDSERDVSGAEFLADRIDTAWQVEETAPPEVAPPSIGISLLTEDPIPLITGARKGPILAMGALFGGTFALLVLALAVDSWRQANRDRAASAYDDRLAIVRPIEATNRYEGTGPLSHRVKTANKRDDT